MIAAKPVESIPAPSPPTMAESRTANVNPKYLISESTPAGPLTRYSSETAAVMPTAKAYRAQDVLHESIQRDIELSASSGFVTLSG